MISPENNSDHWLFLGALATGGHNFRLINTYTSIIFQITVRVLERNFNSFTAEVTVNYMVL